METKCKLWKGYTDFVGYGRLGKALAHRVVYEKHKGPIGKGLEVHHTCGERACVNPDHLTTMTRAQHMRYHTGSRDLTPREISEIKMAHQNRTENITPLIAELAKEYGVPKGVISKAIYKIPPKVPRKKLWLRYLRQGSHTPNSA